MASGEGRRRGHDLVPLAALINREMKNEKLEKPTVRYGCASQSKKGEDFFLIKTDCQRVPGNPSSAYSVFAVSTFFQDFPRSSVCGVNLCNFRSLESYKQLVVTKDCSEKTYRFTLDMYRDGINQLLTVNSA
ncbi:hypothetical protein EUGRSUZ_B02819 [Eucalyptus grandis]|uniref:Uncharacterized protein n=2 Tax=Eucalyptus grandis TaxID=71139 RepID=A0ACC3LV06_EUCGR|nr:hypothetical protein EUGRSUZ_B02819 [Eucalyptus grandis]